MLKMSEIRNLEVSEINEKVRGLRKELFDLKLEKHTATLEKPHRLTQIRKDIARLLTVASEKK